MSTFALHYPDEIAPIFIWAPAIEPLYVGTKRAYRHNAIVHQMADGRVQYLYQRAPAFREFPYRFIITDEEENDFFAFWALTLGATFRLIDQRSSPGFITARLKSLEPEWQSIGDGKYEGDLIFQQTV